MSLYDEINVGDYLEKYCYTTTISYCTSLFISYLILCYYLIPLFIRYHLQHLLHLLKASFFRSNYFQTMADAVELIDSFTGKKDKDEIAVDGYIREMEKKLFIDDQIIPRVINDLCFDYFAIISDTFHPELNGRINVEDYKISRPLGGVDTAFLSNVVNEGVNHWTFEIIEADDSTNIYIGLWDNKQEITQETLREHITTSSGGAPSFNTRFGELRGDVKYIKNDEIYNGQCPDCRKGDVVRMVLKYNENDTCFVNYIVNEKDYGLAFELPKGEYRAFVCLF